MFDLNARVIGALVIEADLDFGRVGSIGPDVPEVAEAPRRVPHRDLTPFHLAPRGRSFEDPPTRAALEDDLDTRLGGHRVVDRPPTRGPLRPDVEGMLCRTLDIEGHTQRLDHGLRLEDRVFSASSLNRIAASPQTSSKYACTASTPRACSW
jgi:hypothetical protein